MTAIDQKDRQHQDRPVEPKPPAPRAVSPSASVASNRRLHHGRHDQLRDPVAVMDGVGFGPEIDQHHAQRAAIIAVDGAGRVREA